VRHHGANQPFCNRGNKSKRLACRPSSDPHQPGGLDYFCSSMGLSKFVAYLASWAKQRFRNWLSSSNKPKPSLRSYELGSDPLCDVVHAAGYPCCGSLVRRRHADIRCHGHSHLLHRSGPESYRWGRPSHSSHMGSVVMSWLLVVLFVSGSSEVIGLAYKEGR